MTAPANPHVVSLQFLDVNHMATTPIQNLSSATNVAADPNAPPPVATAGQLPPVQSKSGILAFVQAEWLAGRPAYFMLDPQSVAPISELIMSPNPDYPYGDPTINGPAFNTTVAAQSALMYGPQNSGGGALPIDKGFGPANASLIAQGGAPVYSPNLPGRWIRVNIAPIPSP